MLALSRYTTQTSEQAAAHKNPLSISRKAKDLAGVHKMLWSQENRREEILQIGLLIGEVHSIWPGNG
jgi:hypothetical protein